MTASQPVSFTALPQKALTRGLPALTGLALLTLPGLAFQEAEPELEPEAPPPESELELQSEGPALSGLLWTRLRTRWNADERDSDLFNHLRLNYGDLERDGYAAHLSASVFADLDGTDTDEFTFVGIYDSYDQRVRARLDLAYLDADLADGLSLFRAGRQQLYATPEFAWFDGLRVESGARADGDPIFGAYAGLAVRPYLSSSDGDLLGGLYADVQPWQKGRLRLDYMRFEDDSLVGEGANDLLSLELRQGLLEGLDVEGSYSMLDAEDRDMEVALYSYGLAEDLTFRASYYELLEPQGTLANELDPFTSSTFTLQPYRQGRLVAAKGLGEELVVEAGVDLRRVIEDADVGEYNRDFERYFLRTTLLDLVDSGFDLSLTGETWRSDSSDIDTWGLDLERQLDEDLELGLGSYYSLYKYDLVLDTERDDVRTYYVDLEYDWREGLRVDLDYVFEDDEFGDQHTLRLGLRWSF